MKARNVLKVAAVTAMVGIAGLGVAPAAAAANVPIASSDVIPVPTLFPTLFGGFATGPTAQTAFDRAVADARARAAAAGFANCEVAGDPMIHGMVRPGFPISYLAQVAVGCTG